MGGEEEEGALPNPSLMGRGISDGERRLSACPVTCLTSLLSGSLLTDRQTKTELQTIDLKKAPQKAPSLPHLPTPGERPQAS